MKLKRATPDSKFCIRVFVQVSRIQLSSGTDLQFFQKTTSCLNDDCRTSFVKKSHAWIDCVKCYCVECDIFMAVMCGYYLLLGFQVGILKVVLVHSVLTELILGSQCKKVENHNSKNIA